MRLWQRNGWYYVQFDNFHRKALNTQDKILAQAKMMELQKAMTLEKMLVLPSPDDGITLDDYFQEYLDWYAQKTAATTYERTSGILKKFSTVIGNRTLNSITEKDIEQYIKFCKDKNNKPITINTEIAYLRACFQRALRWKYLKENPFQYVDFLSYHKDNPHYLPTLEAVDRIFEAIGDDKVYRLAFALYIFTGARRSEIHRLEWKDITSDTITFRERKNYHVLTVPIMPKLREILDEYSPGVGRIFSMSIDMLGWSIKKYLRKAGYGEHKPHDLRHTFATYLLNAGVSMEVVGSLLGHSSLQATQIYAHVLQEQKKQEIMKFPYGGNNGTGKLY